MSNHPAIGDAPLNPLIFYVHLDGRQDFGHLPVEQDFDSNAGVDLLEDVKVAHRHE
jgi:hypothetical protein